MSTDPFRCVWWRGWGSARRFPTSLRPCRWHNTEDDCLCLHPDRVRSLGTAPQTIAATTAATPIKATLSVSPRMPPQL
jgi:hypothetical protein